jgi:hypothetical protein
MQSSTLSVVASVMCEVCLARASLRWSDRNCCNGISPVY